MGSTKFKVGLIAIAGGLFLLASLLPLGWSATRPMPGFIYSPFYTTNIFSDASLNGYKAGLRPEDRVIAVNRQRIDQLNFATSQAGELYLAYELGHVLVGIHVPTQAWSVIRLLEKSGPLFGCGLGLLGLAMRLLADKGNSNNFRDNGSDSGFENSYKNDNSNGKTNRTWLGASLTLSGLALLAAPDYFLSPGAGRESGFDPLTHWHNGEYLALTAKWSSYFYFPLWTAAIAALTFFYLRRLVTKIRLRRWLMASATVLFCYDLGDYLYAAYRTLHYNNPDYIVWHTRSEAWLLWPIIIVLAWVNGFKLRSRARLLIAPLALSLFGAGFVLPTVFDWQYEGILGIGAQWWVLPLACYFYIVTQSQLKSKTLL